MEASLRNLLAAHDNAVIQIVILDREMHSLMLKMLKQLDEGHIIHGMQLAQRRCIMEGVRQMFQLYKENKWRQVQDAISNTVHHLSEEARHIRGSDVDQEISQGSQSDDQNALLHQMMQEAREIRGSDDDETSEGRWSDDSYSSDSQQMLEAREIRLSDDDHETSIGGWTDDSHERWSDDSDLQWSGDNHLQQMLQEALEIRGSDDNQTSGGDSDQQQTSIEPLDNQYYCPDGSSEADRSSEGASEADATYADSSVADVSFADTTSDDSRGSENMFGHQDVSVISVHENDYMSDESDDDYAPMSHGSRQDQYMKTIIRGLVLENCELHRHA